MSREDILKISKKMERGGCRWRDEEK